MYLARANGSNIPKAEENITWENKKGKVTCMRNYSFRKTPMISWNALVFTGFSQGFLNLYGFCRFFMKALWSLQNSYGFSHFFFFGGITMVSANPIFMKNILSGN